MNKYYEVCTTLHTICRTVNREYAELSFEKAKTLNHTYLELKEVTEDEHGYTAKSLKIFTRQGLTNQLLSLIINT